VNFRLTLIFVFVLALIGGYFFFVELQKQPERAAPALWFYNTDDDAFSSISIKHRGKSTTFVKDKEGSWHFDTVEGTPVDINRWGGITLLLRGPQSRRLLLENPEPKDLGRFGLERPPTEINVGTVDGAKFAIFIGDKTPDEVSHYVRMEGLPQVFLIDASWGDVLSRLVTEPPIPPTPTPEGG